MATLKEIADEAGVSVNTVSRVLTGKTKNVWPGMAKRAKTIMAIAERLNYRPNSSARAMRQGRFHSVALLLSTRAGRSFMPHALWQSLMHALREKDLHLTVSELPDEKLTSEGYVPKILREFSADGLLINYTHEIPDLMGELIRRHQAPSVWMNAKLKANCVYPDELYGGRRAAEYLLEMGHRRIAYVSFGAMIHYSETDRRTGYEDGITEAGCRPQCCTLGGSEDPDGQLEACTSLLAGSGRPTAVIANGESEVMSILWAAAQAGLKIPQDLSILTFCSAPYKIVGMGFDTAVIPVARMAQVGVELLEARIRDKTPILPAQPLRSSIHPGQTCVPPAER